MFAKLFSMPINLNATKSVKGKIKIHAPWSPVLASLAATLSKWNNLDLYQQNHDILKVEKLIYSQFTKIIILLAIFKKRSILDVWQGPEYAQCSEYARVLNIPG